MDTIRVLLFLHPTKKKKPHGVRLQGFPYTKPIPISSPVEQFAGDFSAFLGKMGLLADGIRVRDGGNRVRDVLPKALYR